MPNGPLAQRFANIFNDPAAQAMLAGLGRRVTVPTFSFTTTSLRHMRKVFDRLDEINNGVFEDRGNFLSDPAAFGLVDRSTNPATLTGEGQELLSYRITLRDDPAQAEYQLLKILYFGGHAHTAGVQDFLNQKRTHLLSVLQQFGRRRVVLDQPSLLVVAEYIGSFPGALQRFLALSDQDLTRLVELGDEAFGSLCSNAHFTQGLAFLCGKIGGEYRRAQDRRLHQIISMALLEIAQAVPAGGTMPLMVPAPYSNLLTAKDIFDRHTNYTSDVSVWFDGVSYQVSTSMVLAPVPGAALPILHNAQLQPQVARPVGTGQAPANHRDRRKRRGATQVQTRVINPLLSEAAEDYVENTFLRDDYGDNLLRVGHRRGETLSLPDGMVPGADFYVIDAAANPTAFIEVKGIVGEPPADISLTRAEYLRARRCVERGLPYRLILVDIAIPQAFEVNGFDARIAVWTLEEAKQFTVAIIP